MSGKEFDIEETKCDCCGEVGPTTPLETDRTKRICIHCYRDLERYLNKPTLKILAA